MDYACNSLWGRFFPHYSIRFTFLSSVLDILVYVDFEAGKYLNTFIPNKLLRLKMRIEFLNTDFLYTLIYMLKRNKYLLQLNYLLKRIALRIESYNEEFSACCCVSTLNLVACVDFGIAKILSLYMPSIRLALCSIISQHNFEASVYFLILFILSFTNYIHTDESKAYNFLLRGF